MPGWEYKKNEAKVEVEVEIEDSIPGRDQLLNLLMCLYTKVSKSLRNVTVQ